MSELVLTHVRLTVEPQTREPISGGPVELVGFHLVVSECDGSGNELDPPRKYRFPAAANEARLLAGALLDYLDQHAGADADGAETSRVAVARAIPLTRADRRRFEREERKR